ncbi:MAG TPA: dihydropteroate synthase [Vicinamibacterales bacterium]|nr:dihydropteroate synthase [Vicinamibacterales bacterium]
MPALVAPRARFALGLAHGRSLELGPRTLLMGILNVTPDSFAGGVADPDEAAAAALRMEAEGADIVDIGGESTRPGAGPVDAREELARVVPVIERLAGRLRVPISVDTSKAPVAEAAIRAGACLVNDISGLGYDANLGAVAASAGAGLVLMHTRGRPRDMYREAVYGDVVAEVSAELAQALARAEAAGVDRARTVLDPGLGFAKRAEHSWSILAGLSGLAALGRPVLVGPSRKSFLAGAAGGAPPGARDWATAAAVTAAVLAGAHVVRVHNVAALVQVARAADAVRGAVAGADPPALRS